MLTTFRAMHNLGQNIYLIHHCQGSETTKETKGS